ncbi:hypothetical protein D3C79_1081000 [compost metagenome]
MTVVALHLSYVPVNGSHFTILLNERHTKEPRAVFLDQFGNLAGYNICFDSIHFGATPRRVWAPA